MLKRKSILLLLIVVVSVSSYAGIRDQIVIVRPVLEESATEAYDSVATWLENGRYEDLQESFEQRGKTGGFGSGFLYESSEGEIFVITNFHVIEQSNFVNISFESSDGEIISYDKKPVVAADENKDLAIVLLDKTNKGNFTALKIDDNEYDDGDEVWTAGYPGLGAEPLWQLAKGNITNNKARTSELAVNGLDYVIQHSAVISSGSSGGPLLIKKGNTYTVIGVNSWSAFGRDNTYFAIPAPDIIELIESRNQDFSDKENLEKQVKSFTEEIANPETDYLEGRIYLSHDFVFENGWKSYYNYRDGLSESDQLQWDSWFFVYDPFGVMKRSVYRDLKNLFENTSLDFVSIEEIDESAEGKKFSNLRLSLNGEEFNTRWIFEYGSWRLYNITEVWELDDVADQDKSSSSDDLFRDIAYLSIALRPGLSLGYVSGESSSETGFLLGLDFHFKTSSISDVVFGFEYFNHQYEYKSTTYKSNKVGLNFKYRLIIPLSLSNGKFYLTPYLGIGTGFNASPASELGLNLSLIFLASTGIEFAFGSIRDSLSFGLDFTYKNFLFSFGDIDYGSFSLQPKLYSLEPSLFIKWSF